MNLLLISFSFPPAGGVGVLRSLSLAKYLPEHGLRVDVLTAANAPAVGKDPLLLQEVPTTVTVHRCWTLDLPFAWRKGIKKLVSSDGVAAAASSNPGSGGGNFFKRALKRTLGDLLLPDPQVGWLPFAFPAAKRIIRERKIDVVLVTVPPFSSVRLVTMLRRVFPALPVVLDFRDEWLTTTIDFVSFNNNERARAIAFQAEADAVRTATAVVTVTEAARQELLGRYGEEDAGKFLCVPNGFEARAAMAPLSQLLCDAALKRESASCSCVGRGLCNCRPVVLTYLGSVYGSTDPASFVEAVLGLPQALRDRLRVRFIGHIETAAYRATLERMGETVELKGFLPRSEALRELDETDYLLLLTHDRINVSAKFYDYLSGTKPILAAVHPRGEVRRLLEETRAGFWADIGDPAAIREMLIERLRDGPGVEFQPDRERIGQYDRRVLAGRYAVLLKHLAGV